MAVPYALPCMAIGDITAVDSTLVEDCWYVDTGMYATEAYGSVYLLDGERPTLVETGIGTHYERILAMLDSVGVDREDLAYIVPTHVHLDHAGGVGFLAEACPNATVNVHERGVRHLVDPTRLVAGTKAAVGDEWRHYVDPRPIDEERIEPLADGDEVDLGDRTLVAVETPGHASHHHSLHLPEADAVFTADAAGLYVQATGQVRPTTPPPEFDLEQTLDDLDRLEALDPGVLLYSHFGPASDPSLLSTYRQVVTDWVADVERIRAEAPDDETASERLVETHAPVDDWGPEKAIPETEMNVRGVFGYLDG